MCEPVTITAAVTAAASATASAAAAVGTAAVAAGSSIAAGAAAAGSAVATGASAAWGAASAGAAAVGGWGTVVGGASTLMGAYSTYSGEQAKADMSDYNSQAAANNAIYAEHQKVGEIARAQDEKAQLQERLIQQNATGNANLAASGISLGTGSAYDWNASLYDQYAEDAQMNEYNLNQSLYGINSQISNYNAESAMLKSTADSQRSSSYVKAGASALTGSAKVAKSYYDKKANGEI